MAKSKLSRRSGPVTSPASLSRDWFLSNGRDLRSRDGEKWSLVYTRQNREYHVAALCHSMGIPFYLPMTPSRSGEIQLVLPTYLYCRTSTDSLRHLRVSRWILNITPAPAERQLLTYLVNIHETLSAILKHKIVRVTSKRAYAIPAFSVGERVSVTKGLFAGAHGDIIKINTDHTLRVRIDSFGDSLDANIHRDQLTARRVSGQDNDPESRLVEDQAEATLDLQRLRQLVAPVNDELIAFFAKHPEALYELDPHKFEALVADILADMGYEVTLTPPTRDGGRDILAALNIPTGKILTVVECKRYARSRKVGVAAVERLLWVAEQYDRAPCAMLATTSFFSKEAKMLERDYEWRLQLKDFDTLNEWLQRFGSWKGNAHSGLWLPKGISQ